jgi:O-antigen chain-terminating methyltransferase
MPVASTGIRRQDRAGARASGTGFSPPDRGHYNAWIGSATTAARGSAETAVVGSSNRAEDRSGRGAGGAATTPTSIDELSRLDHREFVDNAYLTLLGRPPTAAEREDLLGALLSGDAKSWLLGRLRYGVEGRARAVPVRGLRAKYLAQRLFRTPILGRPLAWLGAVASLPRSLRYLRGFAQSAAGDRIHAEHARTLVGGQVDAASARITHLDGEFRSRVAQLEQALDARIADLDSQLQARVGQASEELQRQIRHLEQHTAKLVAQLDAQVWDRIAQLDAQVWDRIAQLDAQLRDRIAQVDAERRSAIGMLERDLARVTRVAGDAKLRIEALSPPHLAETFELIGGALVGPARDRARVRTDVPASELSEHERYAVFEAAFYDSVLVAEKQRVYLRYLDRALALRQPFLDLGCGRGEFLGILAGAGITPVGVDVNPTAFAGLRSAGFEVVEQDLLAYLQAERRMFSGASALQVIEHLTAKEIDEMLARVAQRLLPGALLIVETPNPLCPFALGQFNTDPTHVAPLPPERLRFAIEAAGFEATRTLFQARAPGAPFAGPDPRAYYMDYAIIAYRSAT